MIKDFKNYLVKNYLTPTIYVNKVTDITLEMLKILDVNLLLMDVDSTISIDNRPYVYKGVKEFVKTLINNGVKIILVSNNFKNRVRIIAESLELPCLDCAMKPLVFRLKKLIKFHKGKFENSAIVGDQIFTDVLAANFLHIKSILVEPLESKESFILKIKRLLERNIKKNFIV